VTVHAVFKKLKTKVKDTSEVKMPWASRKMW